MYYLCSVFRGASVAIFNIQIDIAEYAPKSFLEALLKHARCLYCNNSVDDKFQPCECGWKENPQSSPNGGELLENPVHTDGDYYMEFEQFRQAEKKYRRAGYSRVASEKRQERIAAAGESHSKEDILWLQEVQDNNCYYCGTSLKNGYDIEHIIPLYSYGLNTLINIALACRRCNTRKGRKPARELWMKLRSEVDRERYEELRKRARRITALKRKRCPSSK